MKKMVLCLIAALVLSAALFYALIADPGLLKAEELVGQLLGIPRNDFPTISDEELAEKALLPTGWDCGKKDRHCTHILINDSDFLLCVPTEVRDDHLMVPLGHFRLIAGCGLETDPEGKPLLIKFNTYHLEAGSPLFTCGDDSWILPVAPYEAHGELYVPMRSLGERMGLKFSWHEKTDVVLIHSPGVSADALAAPFTALNQTLLAAMKEEEWPNCLEQVEISVTFYFSKKTPPYTASGAIAAPGSVAADAGIPYGTQFYIPILEAIREDCIFTVHDRGRAVKGDLIDVFVPNDLRSDPLVAAILRRGRFKTTAWLIPVEDQG
ncbi:MAG: stalk domain-containing protein [Clostridiales bacterium]|nr:stalk domain-containing protein [Clostridiales bacterium]